MRRSARIYIFPTLLHRATARMAKLVDAWDLKSPACKGVPVRLRVRAPIKPCEIRYLKRSLRRSFFVFGPCNAPWELHGNLSRIFTHPLQSLHSPPKPSRFPRFPQHLPKKIPDFPEGNKKPGRGGQVLGECLGVAPGPRSSIMLYANRVNLWGRMASRGAVHRL